MPIHLCTRKTLMLIVNGDNQIDFVYDACVA
jgi:hypothetical protein